MARINVVLDKKRANTAGEYPTRMLLCHGQFKVRINLSISFPKEYFENGNISAP